MQLVLAVICAIVAAVGYAVGNIGLGVTWTVIAAIASVSTWLNWRGPPSNPIRSLMFGSVILGCVIIALIGTAVIADRRAYFGIAVIATPLWVFVTWAAW